MWVYVCVDLGWMGGKRGVGMFRWVRTWAVEVYGGVVVYACQYVYNIGGAWA